MLHGKVFVLHGMIAHTISILMPSKSSLDQHLFEDCRVHSQMVECWFWSSFCHNSNNKSNINILLDGEVFVLHGTVVHALSILMPSKSSLDQHLFEDCGVHSQMVECWFWSRICHSNSNNKSNISIMLDGKVFVLHGMIAHTISILMPSKSS